MTGQDSAVPRLTGKWRPGSPERTIYGGPSGGYFTFKSDHPYEERIVWLTEDYADEWGDFIQPELVAWDGVRTSVF